MTPDIDLDALTTGATADAAEAVETLRSMMATNSRDWGAARDDAWFYGLVVGWGQDPGEPDDDCGDAMPELAARHGWSAKTVAHLRRMHGGFVAVPALLSALTATRAELEQALNLLYGTTLYQHHAQCGEASQWDIRRCEDAHCLERAHLLEQHGLLPKEWGTYLAPAAAPKPDEDAPFDCAPECRCGKGAGAGDGEQDTATTERVLPMTCQPQELGWQHDAHEERKFGVLFTCSGSRPAVAPASVQGAADGEAQA